MSEAGGSRRRPSAGAAILLALAVLTLLARAHQLDLRPMHGDEANQAAKAGLLLETGTYVYDPHDHHGPTLYYLALLTARLTGKTSFSETNERTFRIVPVLFGVGIVLLFIPARAALGASAAVAAAMLYAVSPAFFFYGRYFIQETLLVFFTFGALLSGWAYLRTGALRWAVCAGISLSLMHATKETAIIAYVSAAGGLIALYLWQRARPETGEAIARVRAKHLFVAAALGASLTVVLFSAFFTHPRGVMDSVLTYASYLQRADGAGLHDKPWPYYLQILSYVDRGPGPPWSEGFILLFGLIGAAATLAKKLPANVHLGFARFLVVYTGLMLVLYSAIPYKTPWNLLNFFFGVTLLAGLGIATALDRLRPRPLRVLAAIAVAAGIVHLGMQTYRSDFELYADPRNPHVYAHTSTAFLRLSERAEQLARVHPDGKNMLVRVVQPDKDYWPLPWYLRSFTRVGYWHEVPDLVDAPLIIADPGLREVLDARLHDEYIQEVHGLRPGVLRAVYIEKSLWERFMETRR